MSQSPLQHDDVIERLDFAQRRLDELSTLNGGNLGGADPHVRQQLLQEFFFHLVGATDLLAQLTNQNRALGIDSEDVTIGKVRSSLPSGDSVCVALTFLSPIVKHAPVPPDPYAQDGLIFRARNYRHQVTHRRRNPFHFREGADPSASFFLDPRDTSTAASIYPAIDEMREMLKLVDSKCRGALSAL